MAVRNSDAAEEVSKNFLAKKFGWTNSQMEVESVDFDGVFFVVDGAVKREDSDEIDARFSVKVDKERNVVGWKITWA